MSAGANQSRTDIDALQVRLAAALAERDAAIAERDAALSRNDRLLHLLRQLQRMQFGRKSENLDPDRSLWRWRTSSRPSRPAKPSPTSRAKRPPRLGPRSAARTAARFPPIFRAF